MSLFNHFLAISACHSSTAALLFRPKLTIPVGKYYMWLSFAVSPLLFHRIVFGGSFAWHFPIYSLLNVFVLVYYYLPAMKSHFAVEYFYKGAFAVALFPLLYFLSRGDSMGSYLSIYLSNFWIIFGSNSFAAVLGEEDSLLIHFISTSLLFFVGGKTNYFPILVVFITFFTCAASAAVSGDERFRRWMPAAATEENRIRSKLEKVIGKNGKVIELAIGMAGTIVFQTFFRLTTFDHVVAFLYLAVAWVSNMALLLWRRDLGILNFLLGNVIVGCTVSQFGVRGTTWLAYGASVLLYILRLKLEALTLLNRGEDVAALVVWRD